MSSKGERLFAWIQILLLFFGLCLTGAFSNWITFISPNPALGWSIFLAAIATNAFHPKYKSPQESNLMCIEELQDWERIRAKGKRHYILIPGVVFPMLFMTFCCIAIAVCAQIVGSEKSVFENVYMSIPLILVMTGIFYLLRLGIWLSVERRYKATLLSPPPSNKRFDRSRASEF